MQYGENTELGLQGVGLAGQEFLGGNDIDWRGCTYFHK